MVKCPGSAHNAFVWSRCGVQEFLSENQQPGYLLGDQANPLKPFLLIPIRDPEQSAEEANNRLHQITRRTGNHKYQTGSDDNADILYDATTALIRLTRLLRHLLNVMDLFRVVPPELEDKTSWLQREY